MSQAEFTAQFAGMEKSQRNRIATEICTTEKSYVDGLDGKQHPFALLPSVCMFPVSCDLMM
jgi:hypothetical protein